MPVAYDEDFSFTMSDAHRRPAHHFGMPAITWQQGFWKPAGLSEGEWISHIERFIQNLFDNVVAQPEAAGFPERYPARIRNFQRTPSARRAEGSEGLHHLLRSAYSRNKDGKWDINKDIPPSAAKHETVQIDFDWETMPVTIRVEMFDEYFMLSCFISFWKNFRSRGAERYKPLFDDRNELFSAARHALNTIASVAERRYEREGTAIATRQDRKETTLHLIAGNESDLLYRVIWRKLSEELVESAIPKESRKCLGEVFADFRGLILRGAATGRRAAEGAYEGMIGADRIVRPCENVDQRHTAAAIGFPFPPGSQEALRWSEALLPILLAQESKTEIHETRSDTIEYTFSTASQERCLYGSGFGHQGRAMGLDDPPQPLTYVILACHDEHRGIGRFVNRLHTLGGLRLAALRSLRTMRHCGDELSDLRRDLIDIENGISKLEQARAGQRGKSEDIGESAALKTLFGSIHDRLLPVRRRFVDLDARVDGGIVYRSLRSKHYRDRFFELVTAMEFRKLPGYQPYDQFVKHRLGRAYDLIEEVGARYRQVFDMEVRARKLLLLYQSDSHQASINRLTTLIGTFQLWGEVILFLVILPHYAANLLIELLPIRGRDTPLLLPNANLEITAHTVTFVTWALAAAICVAKYRTEILAAVRDNPFRIATFIASILILSVAFLYLAGFVYRH